jgi:hypothetical protein
MGFAPLFKTALIVPLVGLFQYSGSIGTTTESTRTGASLDIPSS